MGEIEYKVWDRKHLMMRSVWGMIWSLDGARLECVEVQPVTAEGYILRPGLDDFDLLEYTGLKDKNGKKIFEGDICEGFLGQRKLLFEVIRSRRGGSFLFRQHGIREGTYIPDMFRNHKDENDCEVIGNKFENPELWEQK